MGGKLVEWEMTEQKGGGLGKSSKGIFPMEVGDYPDENEKAPINLSEVINETPN